jgi:fucose 4-O-acetylase-like acetyltransferase
MTKKEYIVEMQIARGIGIILVTIGHSEPVKFVFPTLFSIIYTFHMPLFFFLSGFFSNKLAKVDTLKEWFKVVPNRLLFLVIPYLTISLSYSFLKYLVPQLAIRPVVPSRLLLDILFYPAKNPALFLWFLYTIVIIQALTPILTRINVWAMIALLVSFQILCPDIKLFGIGLVLNYLLYYYIGLLVSSRLEKFFGLMKNRQLPFLAFLFFAGAYLLWTKTEINIMRPIIALSGITFVLSACFCYLRCFPVKTLEVIGNYSFSIYLLQYFFIFPLYFLLQDIALRGELIVVYTFIAGIAGPLFLVFYVFPHSRVLTLLFSGIQRPSKKLE